jgi:hypothetical protein
MKSMEARVGFEPTNGGFADLSLGPLGYRAELKSIANPADEHAAQNAARIPLISYLPARQISLRAKISRILPEALD